MHQGNYYAPHGGLAGQTELLTGRAVFTPAYAFIPRGVMSDIVTSQLPNWDDTRLWVLSRPMSGFSETFSHYIMEVAPQGGSAQPEADAAAQSALFVLEGHLVLTVEGQQHDLVPGSFAYIPAGANWQIRNRHSGAARFNWIRKIWQPAAGVDKPPFLLTHDSDVHPRAMPDTNGSWATTRFVDVNDMRHDMHITIVTFQPGGIIPFMETHVMEHGLYVLQGKGVYKLNEDWIEVEAGDYMWLRAFCPQACYAAGNEPFRYLLYKDVNRHADLHVLK